MQQITITDTSYTQWVEQLSQRYRQSQIKAALKVNREMLRFYWSLGRDIVALKAEARWGDKFMKNLSRDLKHVMPDATCFSETNIKYMRYFYEMFPDVAIIRPQLVDKIDESTMGLAEVETDFTICPQLVDEMADGLVKSLGVDIFAIPWGHYRYLIDKYKESPSTVLFYVRKTIENGWSRDMLLNMLSTNLHLREGAALTNFQNTLPSPDSDLAQEMTRDPYNFAFTGITGKYNETLLKNKLVNNVTQFLLELGTGFAYIGKEYRLQIDVKEKFIDLLFYNLNLSCYVAVEVKIGEFDFPDMGQIQGYVVAVNHQLRKLGRDNPTIGILICKSKNNTLAQYALEGSNLPIAISEYDLQQLYPEDVEGTIPTIAEIEGAMDSRLIEGKDKED